MTAKTQAVVKKEFSKFLKLVDHINEGHYLIGRVEEKSTLADAALVKGHHCASVAQVEELDGLDKAAKKLHTDPDKLLAFRYRITLGAQYMGGTFNPCAVSFINEKLGERIGKNILPLDRMLARAGIEVDNQVQGDVRMGRGSHVLFMNSDDDEFAPKLAKVNSQLEAILSALKKKMPAKTKKEWKYSSAEREK